MGPELVPAASGMDPQAALIHLADHVDAERLPEPRVIPLLQAQNTWGAALEDLHELVEDGLSASVMGGGQPGFDSRPVRRVAPRQAKLQLAHRFRVAEVLARYGMVVPLDDVVIRFGPPGPPLRQSAKASRFRPKYWRPGLSNASMRTRQKSSSDRIEAPSSTNMAITSRRIRPPRSHDHLDRTCAVQASPRTDSPEDVPFRERPVRGDGDAVLLLGPGHHLEQQLRYGFERYFPVDRLRGASAPLLCGYGV